MTINYLAANWFTLSSAVLGLLVSLYMIFAIISPVTRARWDDRVARWLGVVVGLGRRVLAKLNRWRDHD